MAKYRNRGPSFFELLTTQAEQLVIGADLLAKLFRSPVDERPLLRDRLHEVEQESDDVNHMLIHKLNQTFVTPFDREDISHIAARLDDCMDLFDKAGDLMVLYNLVIIPEPIRSLMETQIEVLTKCAELTAENMPLLKKPRDMRDYWVEINRLENEGDRAYRRTLKNLFDSGLDSISIIKLKDIVEVFEQCTDAFEDMANSIEAIAVKES